MSSPATKAQSSSFANRSVVRWRRSGLVLGVLGLALWLIALYLGGPSWASAQAACSSCGLVIPMLFVGGIVSIFGGWATWWWGDRIGRRRGPAVRADSD